ncbi:uncharacterized protein LOC109949931 [Prunus persica]|uniref:uncharacterized protein LOC109949931 n=1 Tax=Prunus persica TaxID=3760 RepID=UPI0009AB30EC|nr:uncharacterized protein LOC109949931 [Prunus persica]
MGEQCSLLEMRWRPSIFAWEVSCKSSRAFNLRVTDLGSGDFFFSTPFDSGFHLSSLRIFAWFVFRFLSNPYCYIREVEVFKFQNILGSIRKGIESHRLAQQRKIDVTISRELL